MSLIYDESYDVDKIKTLNNTIMYIKKNLSMNLFNYASKSNFNKIKLLQTALPFIVGELDLLVDMIEAAY